MREQVTGNGAKDQGGLLQDNDTLLAAAWWECAAAGTSDKLVQCAAFPLLGFDQSCKRS